MLKLHHYFDNSWFFYDNCPGHQSPHVWSSSLSGRGCSSFPSQFTLEFLLLPLIPFLLPPLLSIIPFLLLPLPLLPFLVQPLILIIPILLPPLSIIPFLFLPLLRIFPSQEKGRPCFVATLKLDKRKPIMINPSLEDMNKWRNQAVIQFQPPITKFQDVPTSNCPVRDLSSALVQDKGGMSETWDVSWAAGGDKHTWRSWSWEKSCNST